MQNAAFRACKLRMCTSRYSYIHRSGQGSPGHSRLQSRGVNVTVPHKERIVRHLDTLSEEVEYVGP
jgi:shikimate 5-dehydrogenase